MDYINHSFDATFNESNEAFGLLVLDNKLDILNKQFEAKQNDPNAKTCGPEYQKKYVDLYTRKVHQDGQLRVKQFIT